MPDRLLLTLLSTELADVSATVAASASSEQLAMRLLAVIVVNVGAR